MHASKQGFADADGTTVAPPPQAIAELRTVYAKQPCCRQTEAEHGCCKASILVASSDVL